MTNTLEQIANEFGTPNLDSSDAWVFTGKKGSGYYWSYGMGCKKEDNNTIYALVFLGSLTNQNRWFEHAQQNQRSISGSQLAMEFLYINDVVSVEFKYTPCPAMELNNEVHLCDELIGYTRFLYGDKDRFTHATRPSKRLQKSVADPMYFMTSNQRTRWIKAIIKDLSKASKTAAEVAEKYMFPNKPEDAKSLHEILTDCNHEWKH